MNKMDKNVAGMGGIVGGIGLGIAAMLTSPGGGEYSLADMVVFNAKDHFTTLLIGLFIAFLSFAGMIRLAAGIKLRLKEDSVATQAYFGSMLLSIGLMAAGWIVVVNSAFSLHYGGGPKIASEISYTIAQAGMGLILTGGGLMLTSALIALFVASKNVLPSWLRGVALVMAAVSVIPWPGAVLTIWSWPIIAGTWMLMSKENTSVPLSAPDPDE